MTVKFKIGFTINGETLFGLMSKMLPIENLEVEEVIDSSDHLVLKPVPAGAMKILNAAKHEPKPQIHKRASPGPNLGKGINGIIVAALSDGPKRAADLQPKAVAAGFSANSVTSRLEELRKFGVIERVGDGKWRLRHG
jgi:hypothetical protein